MTILSTTKVKLLRFVRNDTTNEPSHQLPILSQLMVCKSSMSSISRRNKHCHSIAKQTASFAQFAICRCLTEGAIPKSFGKNIVGSGIGIGVIS